MRIILTICLIFCACSNQIKNKNFITEINSFKEFNFRDDRLKDSLVLFDVDETLIQPVDTYLINEHSDMGKNYQKMLQNRYPSFKEEDWDEFTAIMLREAKRPFLEDKIIEEIDYLKTKNIPVIAITFMNTGKYSFHNSLEEWRYGQLKSLGFTGSHIDKILPIEGFKRNPIFYKGILATDLENKGKILGKFLDQINSKPKKIIMFDDTIDYLVDVQEECKKRNIIFNGYHYKGFKSKIWDQKLIDFQIKYLIENKKWLSDEEAMRMNS